MTLKNKQLLLTAIVSAIIFGILTFFWFPYMATDIPQRYGVPLVFREYGCYYKSTTPCVDQFNVLNLLVDIVVVITPVYGATMLFVRDRKRA